MSLNSKSQRYMLKSALGILESVLFADMRFHDTINRGRLLNRFGKDFEGIDSSLSDNFGRSIQYALSATATLISISVVGGPPFVIAAFLLGIVYWNGKLMLIIKH